MSKKRYDLGVMDVYPLICNNTVIENSPYLQATLTEELDSERLSRAVNEALADFPLFACTVKYKRGYYLQHTDEKVKLFNVPLNKRPLSFGDNTNGYLWQVCYYKNTVSLEWSHAVTDGRGGFEFFSAILSRYFGVTDKRTEEPELMLGLESIYDKNEKGILEKNQPSGYKASELPYLKRGYKSDCHVLRAPMQQVLSVSKKNDASPASVLPPLFSMAIRKHLPENAKNRNVVCNMPVDCRGVMKMSTMHNFIVGKKITYTDKFDSLEFSLVSTIYRAFLDLAVQPENIVRAASEMVKLIRPISRIRPKPLLKLLGKIFALVSKHTDSNFTFTYLGRLSLPDEVMDKTEDFCFRSWTDFGECNIAAVDVKGTLVINICENFADKTIIKDFIDICEQVGIEFTETEDLVFEQANLRIKGI